MSYAHNSGSRANPINLVDNERKHTHSNMSDDYSVSYPSSQSSGDHNNALAEDNSTPFNSPPLFQFSANSRQSQSSYTSMSSSNFLEGPEFFDEFDQATDVMSIGSLSPAPSVYSLTESLRASSTKEEHGRGVNCYSDVYRLPADKEEWSRLDLQHHMFKMVMGDFSPQFREIMRDDDPTTRKSCLDLGCGSGSWIIDVAREFPNSRCVAVDLVPMANVDDAPANVRSEVDDINLGLEHFFGQFHVVHARLINSGIKDYYKLIDETSRILIPGGLADFLEFDFRVCDVRHRPIVPSRRDVYGPYDPRGRRPPGTETPWLARWFFACASAARMRGGHIDSASLLERWIKDHKGFEDVTHKEIWLPSGPWMKGRREWMASPHYETLLQVAEVMTVDLESFLGAGRPLLLSSGLSENVVDLLQHNATAELREGAIPMWFHVQHVQARRKTPQNSI